MTEHGHAAVLIDYKLKGSRHDITDIRTIAALTALTASPQCMGVFASPPCSAWSAARFNREVRDPAPILHRKGYEMGIYEITGDHKHVILRSLAVDEQRHHASQEVRNKWDEHCRKMMAVP